MTDRVEPSPNKGNKVFATVAAIQWAGFVDGWIAPTDEAYVADVEGLTGAPLDAFNISTSGLTATIDTGEGFVEGRWVARDVTTDVALADDTVDQTIYLGWTYGSADSVTIGLDTDFAANDGRIPVWDVSTASGAVSGTTDRRTIGPPLSSDGGDLVVNALLQITDTVELNASIETTRTGFGGAPLLINNTTAFSELGGWATMYNTGGSGWRFRDNNTGDAFRVNPDGSAEFPNESVHLAIENRTNRPSGTQPGRLIYRTDKE